MAEGRKPQKKVRETKFRELGDRGHAVRRQKAISVERRKGIIVKETEGRKAGGWEGLEEKSRRCYL